MATANPVMNESVYRLAGRSETATSTMTLSGTAIKTGILVAIMLITAGYTWSQMHAAGNELAYGLLVGGAFGGLIAAFVTFFVPRISPITAPIYAALEGLVLGGISAIFEARYPGIAIQAVGLTGGTLVMMLVIYGTGIIRVTEKVRIGIVAATGAICLLYMVAVIMRFFGGNIPYIHESTPFGIGFSVVVVVIAALNLILDFDFIEQGVKRQAPKYMEWYGGFSLLVTLVWMYMEILRLLSKLKDR
jgi:uncharacterized YccA/Bax inhibitor family protein